MFITEQNGSNLWAKMLKENFNVQDEEKINWVSQYAATHEIFEASLGLNGTVAQPGLVVPTQGVNPLYATPANTMGMGNPMMPQNLPVSGDTPGSFFKQQTGSGDIPVSTLPMALNVALITVGLELVPVIPSKGPFTILSYMDFPYAGGKMGRRNEIAGFDGIGEGRENKPLYFKVLDLELDEATPLRQLFGEDDKVTFTAGEYVVKGAFKSFGLMDGGLIVEVISVKNGEDNASIGEAFRAGVESVTIQKAGLLGEMTYQVKADTTPRVDFAQTQVDFVDGFANFATGKKDGMTRAENETGTGNVIGLRLFTKFVQVKSYEVTGTVTRQQLQDLPLYGVDAQAKIMEVLQNELTQSINARILEHVFALGVTNAVAIRAQQGVDLNLHMGTTDTTMAATGVKHYKDIYGVDHKATWGKIKNSEVNTSAENLHTRQRRIASRILAAANLIQVTGRRGRATWVVTNSQIITALQDVSSYVVAPMVNNMAQDGSQNLFLGGTLAGLKVYVDPYMAWDDTRVCVGRKGTGNEPGVIFMPYILADTITITAEGTMAPKMLVNSRYQIVDAGFFPEKLYYTFVVDSPEFGII
jgi:hypothetical protein